MSTSILSVSSKLVSNSSRYNHHCAINVWFYRNFLICSFHEAFHIAIYLLCCLGSHTCSILWNLGKKFCRVAGPVDPPTHCPAGTQILFSLAHHCTSCKARTFLGRDRGGGGEGSRKGQGRKEMGEECFRKEGRRERRRRKETFHHCTTTQRRRHSAG